MNDYQHQIMTPTGGGSSSAIQLSFLQQKLLRSQGVKAL